MQTYVPSGHSSAVHGQGVRASRGCPMHTSNVLSTGTMLQRCDKRYTHVCMHEYVYVHNGQVLVRRRKSEGAHELLHFKARDTSVNFFRPGCF